MSAAQWARRVIAAGCRRPRAGARRNGSTPRRRRTPQTLSRRSRKRPGAGPGVAAAEHRPGGDPRPADAAFSRGPGRELGGARVAGTGRAAVDGAPEPGRLVQRQDPAARFPVGPAVARVATLDRGDRVGRAVNQHRGHRVGGPQVAQAGRQPARDGGEHRHLLARFERHPVGHECAVGHARDHGAVGMRAVPFGRGVDERAEERDIVHARLVGRGDAAAVGPAAADAVG